MYCTATRACSEATIVANNADVVCSADSSCEYGEFSAAAPKSYGLRSSAFSVIDAASFIGFGSYSLSYADVDSVNRAALSVRLWDDFSGYGATLVCRSGSKCVLDGKGTGCMDEREFRVVAELDAEPGTLRKGGFFRTRGLTKARL